MVLDLILEMNMSENKLPQEDNVTVTLESVIEESSSLLMVDASGDGNEQLCSILEIDWNDPLTNGP